MRSLNRFNDKEEMTMRKLGFFVGLTLFASLASGCSGPQIKLFPDGTEPLQEFVVEGTAGGKVLVLPIQGIISDEPRLGFVRNKPSMVQEIVSQLRLAEKDKEVKAVLLKIDSPGGSVTASDLLYHEIKAFKDRTGAKVVVAMMDVAASGAYYAALSGDFILAHPTTLTGSIGVIFLDPKLIGLMEKIGVNVEVHKSGKNKDMGSPFRQSTPEEENIIQDLTNELGRRFLSLVAEHRQIDKKTLDEIAAARVYLAKEAFQLKLVDQIGYLSDALLCAKKLAGLPANSKVIVYRRTEYPNDNLYNTSTMQCASSPFSLVDVVLPPSLASLNSGFYYLWVSGIGPERHTAP
jgi:protease-4